MVFAVTLMPSLSGLDLVKRDWRAGECAELDWETPPQLLHHSKAIQNDSLPSLHTRIVPAAARQSRVTRHTQARSMEAVPSYVGARD